MDHSFHHLLPFLTVYKGKVSINILGINAFKE
jgi:hypothetical protein